MVKFPIPVKLVLRGALVCSHADDLLHPGFSGACHDHFQKRAIYNIYFTEFSYACRSMEAQTAIIIISFTIMEPYVRTSFILHPMELHLVLSFTALILLQIVNHMTTNRVTFIHTYVKQQKIFCKPGAIPVQDNVTQIFHQV